MSFTLEAYLASMQQPEAEPKAPTVVVASNDKEWTRAIAKMLSGLENNLLTTKFNRSLLEALSNESPCIVLYDPRSERANDIQLSRKLAEQADRTQVYLLLATDLKCVSDPKCPLLELADDFVTKPITKTSLLARLAVAQRTLAARIDSAQREEEMRGLRSDLEEQNRLLDEAMSYLSGANNRFADLFEGIPAACYCLDDQGRIHEWNKAAADMYGFQAHEVISRYIWDVFGGSGGKNRAKEIRRNKEIVNRLLGGECLHGIEVDARCKDGRVLHVLRNTITMMTSDQKTRGVVTADIDITARRELERQVLDQLRALTELNAELKSGQKKLAKANAQLEKLAATDSMTGLRNRRFFQDTLTRSFSFAERHAMPLSLIMIDVDHFKSYNDCFGHQAGDELLKSLARLLELGVRNHDSVARYGGEEFVVLLPTTGIEGSKEAGERLRHSAETFEWPLRPVTISVGAATFAPEQIANGKDPGHELIKEADKALYYAKARGRNRVEHFSDIPNPSRSQLAHGRGAKRAA
jgi:two-component system cell cycle response regulator